MAYKPNVWNQLKNLSKGELVSALVRDGWEEEPSGGSSEHVFTNTTADGSVRAVAIHFHHAGDTFGRALLKALLADIGWTEADLIRLKLVRR